MSMTAAQYQRDQDAAAEIEARAEELKEQARKDLSALKRHEFADEFPSASDDKDYLTDFDVMEEVQDKCMDEVTLAFSLLDSDPLEAVRILKEARDKAVDHTLARIDFERVAKAEIEQARKEAA